MAKKQIGDAAVIPTYVKLDTV